MTRAADIVVHDAAALRYEILVPFGKWQPLARRRALHLELADKRSVVRFPDFYSRRPYRHRKLDA